MTINECIKKYELKKQKCNCFGDLLYYDLYINRTEENGITTVYTLSNQAAVDFGESGYMLDIMTTDENIIVGGKYPHPKLVRHLVEAIEG